MRKGEDGMDVASSFEDDEEMPSKSKMRPAPLVLTLTDEQAALAAPESNQLLHLQLGKRYYAERLILCGWLRVLCACSFLLFFSPPCFPSRPHCFLSERKDADTFPLLIILAYFYRCGG